MRTTVRELAALVGGEVCGDGALVIERVAPLDDAAPAGSLVWIGQPAQLETAERSGAVCVLAPLTVTASRITLIRVAHPKLAFAHILQTHYPPQRPPAGVHPLSVVSASARLGRTVTVGPHAVIGDRVVLGDRVVVEAGVVIEPDCVVGDDTYLHPRVTLYHHTQVGRRVIIHAGAVVGSDGFGFVVDPATQQQVKVLQIGHVVLEDDVELGANVTIDRATIGATILRRGVKVDNLVQIAHNVVIGEYTTISAQTGIAGSTTIGHHCVIAGQAGIGDRVVIEDGAVVGGQTGVPSGKRIRAGQVVWGLPARPLDAVKQEMAALRRLPALLEEVAHLRQALSQAGVALPVHAPAPSTDE